MSRKTGRTSLPAHPGVASGRARRPPRLKTKANNAAQAKALVKQQYGPEVDVLYCKPADIKD